MKEEGEIEGFVKFICCVFIVVGLIILSGLISSIVGNYWDFKVQMAIVTNATEVAKEIVNIFKR